MRPVGWGEGVCGGQNLPRTPAPTPSFLPFLLCQTSFVLSSICAPPVFIPPEPLPFLLPLPQQASQAGPYNPNSLTYFGTVCARSAREATGTLKSLGPGRATFAWETSFAL